MMSSVALTDGLKMAIYFKFQMKKFHTILYPEVLFSCWELEQIKTKGKYFFFGVYEDVNI
jgi:hypothetical protein